MDEMAHKLLKNRVDQTYFRIIEIHPTKRGDLMRMWKHSLELWHNLDKEMVACRRRQKPTAHFLSINDELDESLNTVEQYLVWASLSN